MHNDIHSEQFENNSSKRPWYRGLIIDKIITKTNHAFIKYHPNMISILSLILAFLSFRLLVNGYQLSFFLLLQISYYLDCMDGYVARTTNKSSKLGKVLDVSFDFIKVFALFWLIFALGIGGGSIFLTAVYSIYCLSVLGRMAQGIFSSLASSSAEKRGSAFNETLLNAPQFSSSAYRRWCDQKKLNYFPLGVSEQIYLLSPFVIFLEHPYSVCIVFLLFSLRMFQLVVTIRLSSK